jgi:7-cyano-7-deazaguanine synthase
MNPRTAVVLLSGGLDSATVLALARTDGYRLCALTVRYGQRHAVEIEAARRVAAAMHVERHVVLDVDLRALGGSALTADVPVPKHRPADAIATGIPITYVPARNTIFLSCALALAEVEGASDIFVGMNAVDYSGYPDCRPEYLAAFQHMANLATRSAVEGQTVTIHAPLVAWTKAEIIRRGTALGVDYGLTVSCYDPDADATACGACDACQIRRRGFADADVPDPTMYRAGAAS